jgi:YD repeat-containing protein
MTAESWTEYAYANNGRTVKINYGGLVFQEQNRDAFGNTISVKDGMGNETKYFYNELGQLICEENGGV